jgi:hypothetical protein
LLSYEKDGNKKSILFISLIGVTTIAVFISIIWASQIFADASNYKYIFLYLCMLLLGFLSLVFMRELKVKKRT